MKVIGLTGGIGAGKSTVSDYLLDKGFTVIDADKIARSMTEKGSETLQALTEAFGEDILFTDGCLDRKKLAAIVFSDEKKRLVLEELTTKKVVQIIEKITGLQEEGYEAPVFIDAPLLFESGADKLCDAVWLVDASIDIRIRRVMARDDVTSEEVKRRILNQMSSSEKIARSTDIIDNSKGKEALYKQVERLLERYAETK